MWKAKWSAVKILFFVNRYAMAIEGILILVGFTLSWSQAKCERFFIPWQTFLPVIISGAGGILLILRTHAIVSGGLAQAVCSGLIIVPVGQEKMGPVYTVSSPVCPNHLGCRSSGHASWRCVSAYITTSEADRMAAQLFPFPTTRGPA